MSVSPYSGRNLFGVSGHSLAMHQTRKANQITRTAGSSDDNHVMVNAIRELLGLAPIPFTAATSEADEVANSFNTTYLRHMTDGNRRVYPKATDQAAHRPR